jgi:hypothetical protein
MGSVHSEIEVVNQAFELLGHKTILDFEEESPEAVLAKSTYPTERDAALRSFTWNFAIHRDQLSADSVGPSWEYQYAYTIPDSCLRVLECNGDVWRPWRVEGLKIVTDIESPLQIRYIQRVANVGSYDPMFVKVLAARCAVLWVERLSRSSTLRTDITAYLSEVLKEAASSDSVEKTPEVIRADTWLNAHEGRSGASVRFASGAGQTYSKGPGTP